MGGVFRVLLNNISVNLVNKHFLVFCFPQLESTEFEGQEREGVESVTVQSKLTPISPTDSDANRRKGQDITFVGRSGTITAHNRERANMVYNQEVDPKIGSLYAHSRRESSPVAAITSGQEVLVLLGLVY